MKKRFPMGAVILLTASLAAAQDPNWLSTPAPAGSIYAA
jgi:hypothetical protein